jgi:urease accessory protein
MNARKLTKLVPALALGAVAAVAAEPALAHHPLGGAPMTTFAHGVLSGIGHPLLGFDHLFFVLAVGLAALYTGHRFTAPAAYIAAMLAGCLMMSLGVGLPAKEIVIGLSLLAVGAVVLSGRAMSILPAVAVFAAFGMFHGSAFGDTMAAQEAGFGAPVLVGYLLGLGVLQYGIAVAAGTVALKLFKATESTAVEARLAGAVVAGVGMFLTLENMEGIVLGAVL